MNVEIIYTQRLTYYQHKEDEASMVWDGKLRPCASKGCPAVFWAYALPVKLTKQWQFYIRACNMNTSIQKIISTLASGIAFCNEYNGLDFKANYLTGERLTRELPKFDAVRFCSRALLASSQAENNGYVYIESFDGNKEPPLKAGRHYPNSVEEINPDDYLYHPMNRNHRHLFFAANNVKTASQDRGGSIVFPFAQGAAYDYMGDNEIYLWIPVVSPIAPIKYQRSRLLKLSSIDQFTGYYRK